MGKCRGRSGNYCMLQRLRRKRCSFSLFTVPLHCVATALLASQASFFFSVFYFCVDGWFWMEGGWSEGSGWDLQLCARGHMTRPGWEGLTGSPESCCSRFWPLTGAARAGRGRPRRWRRRTHNTKRTHAQWVFSIRVCACARVWYMQFASRRLKKLGTFLFFFFAQFSFLGGEETPGCFHSHTFGRV